MYLGSQQSSLLNTCSGNRVRCSVQCRSYEAMLDQEESKIFTQSQCKTTKFLERPREIPPMTYIKRASEFCMRMCARLRSIIMICAVERNCFQTSSATILNCLSIMSSFPFVRCMLTLRRTYIFAEKLKRDRASTT